MKVKMSLTINNSEYDTLLEKIGSLDAKLQRIKIDKRDFGKDARERAAELTLNKALKLEIASCVEKGCKKIENTLDKNSWSKSEFEDVINKTTRSTATDVKKLVKRFEKDDGKTVVLLEDIQAKLLGISKQMRTDANKDINRWDEILSHLYRDRWWQFWKWPAWNFRVSFSRRED